MFAAGFGCIGAEDPLLGEAFALQASKDSEIKTPIDLYVIDGCNEDLL